jgi:hypothetical protein
MVEILISEPKFRTYYIYVTVSLSKFSCTAIAAILELLLNASDYALFQLFHLICEIFNVHFFLHLPHSRDPL